MEDPFDATDNCARTIGFAKIDSIVKAFGRAAAVMNAVRNDAGRLLLQTVFPLKAVVLEHLPCGLSLPMTMSA